MLDSNYLSKTDMLSYRISQSSQNISARSGRTAMNSNNKLAPISCHCKLNVLVMHLKQLSAQKVAATAKPKTMGVYDLSEALFQRYI